MNEEPSMPQATDDGSGQAAALTAWGSDRQEQPQTQEEILAEQSVVPAGNEWQIEELFGEENLVDLPQDIQIAQEAGGRFRWLQALLAILIVLLMTVDVVLCFESSLHTQISDAFLYDAATMQAGAMPPASDPPLQKPMVNLGVRTISQLPEMPNGCEITSLAIVLQYYGYDIDKEELCARYLKQGDYADPFEGFLGSPLTDAWGYGCYAPPIVQAANEYLEEQNAAQRAVDVSGMAFEELLQMVNLGYPVIIWTTLQTADTASIYEYDGIHWYRDSHCVVISGETEGGCICADPIYGTQIYDKQKMKEKYELLYRQAVLIQ